MHKLILLVSFGFVVTTIFYGCTSQSVKEKEFNSVRVESLYRTKEVFRSEEVLLEEVATRHLAKGNAGILVGVIFPDGHECVITRGVADVKNFENLLSTNSIFRIGSITKDLMLILCEKLEKKRLVDFDKSVYETFDKGAILSKEYASVTLRDLIQHTSGLPREDHNWYDGYIVLDSLFNDGHIYRAYTTKEGLFKTLNSSDCISHIRKRETQYSNLGYGLLGLAIEEQTGRELPDLFDEFVSAPLGLKDTSFSLTDEQTVRLVGSHSGDVPFFWWRNVPMRAHDLGKGMRATGGLYSSGADQMKCLRLYLNRFSAHYTIPVFDESKEEQLHLNHYLMKSSRGHNWLVRYGMTYGSAVFVGFDLTNHTAVLILRNNCDWPDTLGIDFMSELEAYCESGPLLSKGRKVCVSGQTNLPGF